MPKNFTELMRVKPAKVDQEIARYEPPEHGPFKCGNCDYFVAPYHCRIIEGLVESEGCCILFEHKDDK